MSHRTFGPAWSRACVLTAVALLVAAAAASAQAPPPPAPAASAAGTVDPDSEAGVLARLGGQRDEFLRAVVDAGYKPCKPPTIQLGDPLAYGNYVARTNTLQIAGWTHLSATEKQGFEDMAQHMHGEASARSVFENGTYRWVFVHELGHWWQSCQHKSRPDSYAAENGANRIALAYWHEADPRFAGAIVRGFRGLVGSRDSPVPPGQSPQAYLNANFTRIAHSDDYVWFQGKMVVDLAEMAPPSLHDALAHPLYPK